jgi:protein involved in polysaccharide export with SLBB domain
MQSVNPAEDIVLEPYDQISVDRAEPVYVTGEVNRVGGIELGDRDFIYLTQLITMVGGLGKDAAPEKARILRPVLDTAQRAEIPVDLKKILSGEATDFPLTSNDVLYVPRNSHKVALGRVGLIAVPLATSMIYVLVSRL